MHKHRSSNSTEAMLFPTDLSAPGAVDALLAAHRAAFGGFVMERGAPPQPFQIPEDVTQVEDLEASAAEATAEGERIGAQDVLSQEDLDRLDALAAYVEAVAAEAARREEEAAEGQARRDAALARLRGEVEDTETPAEGDEPAETPAEGEPAEGDTPAEGETPPAEGEQPAPQAVAASVVRRRAPSLIRRTRPVENPTPAADGSTLTITASAGTGVEMGQRLPDLDAVVTAFQHRSRAFPKSHVPGMYAREQVASISRGGWGDLDPSNFANDQELITAAGDEHRPDIQARGGLVAAGWCAPSETIYDLTNNAAADSLINLPEAPVRRGGWNFTLGADFADVFAGVGFAQTEAQAEAQTVKPCYVVDCPDFDEVRLDAVGICIKAGILQNVGYPELVRDVIAKAMVAHQIKVANRMVAAVTAEIGAAATVVNSGSAARSVLTSLELAAEGERIKYSLGENEVLEVLLPRWLRVVLRDDLAARSSAEVVDNITNAVLDSHFVDRGVRVQWIRGLNDLTIPATGLVAFPATVTAVMYPAGTFVKGVQDVISLDTVYDSTDLTTNVYTAIFLEEAVLLARRGYGGVALTIPLTSQGRSGPLTLSAYGTAFTP